MSDREETTSTNTSTVATPTTATNAMASNISPVQGIHPPRPLDVKGNVADKLEDLQPNVTKQRNNHENYFPAQSAQGSVISALHRS